MNMTERQLRLFVQIAAEMNLSRASEKLHLTQPALTRALQDFEAQLDVRLFHRTTRRLTLTAEGIRFLPVAQRLLDDMQHARAELREQTTGLSGTVTIATGTAIACAVMPPVLLNFSRRHPGVRVALRDENSEGISGRVARAEVDFGIGSIVADTSAFAAQRLLSAPLGLLANPRCFPLPARLTPKLLRELPLLKEADDTSIMKLLRQHGSPLVGAMDRGFEVSNLATQIALATAGVGVAVLSALGASVEGARRLSFMPLTPAIRREVFLFHRNDRPLRPAGQALAAAISTALPQTRLHPRVTLYG